MKYVVSMLVLAMLAGCATVQSTLASAKPDYTEVPEEALRAVAAEVEGLVARGVRDIELTKHDGVTLDTPAMTQAIRTRATRHPLIEDLLNSGFANERRNGLIYIERSKKYKQATTSRQRSREAAMVISENRDRWTIYEGLEKENGYDARGRAAIQTMFFEARRDLMSPGQRYEDESGTIVTK